MNIIMSIIIKNQDALKEIPKCYHPKKILNPTCIPRKGDIVFLGDKYYSEVKSVSWQFNEDEILITVTIS
jgi:hypothetical protein